LFIPFSIVSRVRFRAGSYMCTVTAELARMMAEVQTCPPAVRAEDAVSVDDTGIPALVPVCTSRGVSFVA
jgi:hypothetical protein